MTVRDIYTVDQQWDYVDAEYGDGDAPTADEAEFWALNPDGRPA